MVEATTAKGKASPRRVEKAKVESLPGISSMTRHPMDVRFAGSGIRHMTGVDSNAAVFTAARSVLEITRITPVQQSAEAKSRTRQVPEMEVRRPSDSTAQRGGLHRPRTKSHQRGAIIA